MHLGTFGGRLAAEAICDPDPARLGEWEERVSAGAELFIDAVTSFYRGVLTRYLFTDDPRTYLRRAITSMLAGDVFGDERWVRDMRTRIKQLV